MLARTNRGGDIGIVVVTHCAVHLLRKSLPPLLALPQHPRVLVVNSSSKDGTVELARALGAETLVVERTHFNHGATREQARRVLGGRVVVMMTPDAVPANPEMVPRLVRPLLAGEAEMSYARQLPHPGAGFFEAYPRRFNYPAESNIRSLADAARYGSYLPFCSDSCAAWRNDALDRVGGFEPALIQEDGNTAVKLLRAGGRIAYVADAEVHHSHRYSLVQEFQRYFDTGYERRFRGPDFFAVSSDLSRGKMFAAQLLRELWATQPQKLPYGVLTLAAKYLGYKTGSLGLQLPRAIARKLSAQDFFWDSIYAGLRPGGAEDTESRSRAAGA